MWHKLDPESRRCFIGLAVCIVVAVSAFVTCVYHVIKPFVSTMS